MSGHGTHVASLAAGRTFGVAKEAKIIAVKVFANDGSSDSGAVVEGIEWTVKSIKQNKKESRSVVNLSLGGHFSSHVMEGAVQSAIDDGITFTIAAGNSFLDACEFTPAKVSAAITVAASDKVDEITWFSNFGPCIDIVAPGEDILGAGTSDRDNVTLMSGTSMASPYVAGIIARYLSSLSDSKMPTPLEIKSFVIDSANDNQISIPDDSDLASTPNKLLHMACNVEPISPLAPLPIDESECRSRKPLWHLARISSRQSSVNYDRQQYHYSSIDDGDDVDVYVVDTGIYIQHNEFEGRAEHGFTAPSLNEPANDYNGHGTHVASLAGGRTLGVARKANLISVKVLDHSGSGSLSSILEGLEWISNDIERKRATNNLKKFVINMSLGAPQYVYPLEQVMAEMTGMGVAIVVAAGNSEESACWFSPARSNVVITVGATTKRDTIAYFSNYGSCVDILAPGDYITGAFISDPEDTVVLSGTSQAAPLVAGNVARYLSSFKDPDKRLPTPSEIHAYLVDSSTPGLISFGNDYKMATPDLLLFAGCLAGDDDYGSANVVYPSSIVAITLLSLLLSME